MNFQVELDKYKGPLQLLLELIEKQELPITEVSLAKVTDDYLVYINTHESSMEDLSDFLVIATRLLLIKSRELLPDEQIDEEETKTSLAAQLQLYKLFAEAAELINAQHQNAQKAFPRTQADVVKLDEFILPEGMTISNLETAFSSLMKRLEPFFRIKQSTLERVSSVKERLKEIHDALLSRARMTFKDLVSNGRSKVDIVVSFLALLELVKQRSIRAVQSESFSDIEIKKVD
ncbi:segregation/condensation protein A [Candidatus Uhrbacteria bacterium]|nr:segregation/condensation protein A [Candidatus Uhrbacteria bacterium]